MYTMTSMNEGAGMFVIGLHNKTYNTLDTDPRQILNPCQMIMVTFLYLYIMISMNERAGAFAIHLKYKIYNTLALH